MCLKVWSEISCGIRKVSVPEGSIALLLGACNWSKYSLGSRADWKNTVSSKPKLWGFLHQFNYFDIFS